MTPPPRNAGQESQSSFALERSPISAQIHDHIHAGHQKYRPDIDGLRAISILLVIAYHTLSGKWSTIFFGGGFAGVDVFFTISGFLISSIIFSEISDQKFSFAKFYARRVRRIFPALIVILLVVYVLGALLFLTDELKDLAKYIASSAGFVANLVLLNSISYFDSNSNLKPLLHMWSLGIEEQFYFFWPLALIAAHKTRFSIKYLLVATFLLSFASNIYFIHYDAPSAFYLPFTRFFELIAGAGIAYFTIFRHSKAADSDFGRKVRTWFDDPAFCNALSWTGAGFLLAADLLLSTDRAFPGWWALLPVMGGTLLIAAGSQAWVNRRVLAHPVMVFIGVISYPLYLWHWPLLSFLNVVEPNPSRLHRAAAIILAFILSWLTYRVVEHPLRFGKSRLIVPLLCAMVAILGCGALYLNLSDSLAPRGDPRDLAQLKWVDSDPSCYRMLGVVQESAHDAIFCYVSDNSPTHAVAILGDSMGNSLYPGLRKAYARQGVGVINLGVGTCAPFHNLYGSFEWNKDCKEVNDKIYDYVVKDSDIKTVILGFSSWDIRNMGFDPDFTPLTEEQRFTRITAQVNKDIAYLRAHGKTVIATFDGPQLPADPRRCIFKNVNCNVPQDVVEAPIQIYLDFWSHLLGDRADVCVFSQMPYLKVGKIYPMRQENLLTFRDDHHLSFHGSDVVAAGFMKSPCAAPQAALSP